MCDFSLRPSVRYYDLSDQEECEVRFVRERGEIEIAAMWTYPFLVTKILIVNELGTVFMGTSAGRIRAYQWPFTDLIKFSKSFTEV